MAIYLSAFDILILKLKRTAVSVSVSVTVNQCAMFAIIRLPIKIRAPIQAIAWLSLAHISIRVHLRYFCNLRQ